MMAVLMLITVMIKLWRHYKKRFGLPDCLLLFQIPMKTIHGLFNNFTQFLMLNTKSTSKHTSVNLVQLKQDANNRNV